MWYTALRHTQTKAHTPCRQVLMSEDLTATRSAEGAELDWHGANHATRVRKVYKAHNLEFDSRNAKQLQAQLDGARLEQQKSSRQRMARVLEKLSEATSPEDSDSAASDDLPQSLLAPEIPVKPLSGGEWTPQQRQKIQEAARKDAEEEAHAIWGKKIDIWGKKIDLDQFNDRVKLMQLEAGEEYWLLATDDRDGPLADPLQHVALDDGVPPHHGVAANVEKLRRKAEDKEEARLSDSKWVKSSISANGRSGKALEPPKLKGKRVDQYFEACLAEKPFKEDTDLSLPPDLSRYARDEDRKFAFLLPPGEHSAQTKRQIARRREAQRTVTWEEPGRAETAHKRRKMAMEAYLAPVAMTLAASEAQEETPQASTPPSIAPSES
ncbi:hypothetical protein CKM354_001110300 [Cercospora kikuchii]|uniref:Uncharacterized protein n=1 Tax=Cercospora kikuchii TaxID=84275 RepID=A0A9P3CZY6_9PEZI|nr:uncharacterized protein CKM354_001110300 [Cercospora kikuchii]GIZ48028.1 hypothetical protein CKM354_001110300 [Cercospora kikuchii]